MQVVEFIKSFNTIPEGFEALTEQFGIKVKAYADFTGAADPLVVLDYSQIDSPKTHPIVIECRGLTLNARTLEVVARGFDRFFNYGEAQNVMVDIDWSKATLFEKVDGSFIKIYFFNNKWEVATRGTAFAESDCMGHGITFRELVYKALGVANNKEFQQLMRSSILQIHNTYLFELTSVENRVVKHYHGYKLHFLGSRQNDTGYIDSEHEIEWLKYSTCPLKDILHFPKQYKFNSAEECLNVVRELKDLDEGYVLYQNGLPVCKIKSPTYVAVHHIRGEGLNPKRMSQLVLSGECDEYLTYFPDDQPTLQPYIDAKIMLDCHMDAVYDSIRDTEDQKEFAKKAAPFPFKAAMFSARQKDISVEQAFIDQRETFKIDILKGYVK